MRIKNPIDTYFFIFRRQLLVRFAFSKRTSPAGPRSTLRNTCLLLTTLLSWLFFQFHITGTTRFARKQFVMTGRDTYREIDPLVGGGGQPDYVGPRGPTSWIVAAVTGIFLLILFETSFTVIKPGEVGVVVTLGHITTFPPGPHFRAPFISRVTRMSTKTQLLEQANTIPTKEGLSVRLDTAM